MFYIIFSCVFFSVASATLGIWSILKMVRLRPAVQSEEDILNWYRERHIIGTRIVSLRDSRFLAPIMALVRGLANYNERMNLERYEASVKADLQAAGSPGNLTPGEYLAVKELLAIAALVGGAVLFRDLGRVNILLLPSVMIGAYFLPNFFLSTRTRNRQKHIVRTLPNICDLLTVSTEAGLDFSAALRRVVEKGQPGPLRDEFRQVFQEMKIGKTRREALNAMAQRIGLFEVSAFISSLVQADILGTGVSEILRVNAEVMRNRRFQRAERLANEAPVKILFPLIFCIMPCVFIMIFFPIAIRFLESGM
ncbi:MAG: type II secretion system F family protein [Myxococcales bacterium]|nr:type II secretion system F family protein [Myxococcales bacterium]